MSAVKHGTAGNNPCIRSIATGDDSIIGRIAGETSLGDKNMAVECLPQLPRKNIVSKRK